MNMKSANGVNTGKENTIKRRRQSGKVDKNKKNWRGQKWLMGEGGGVKWGEKKGKTGFARRNT